MHTIFLSRKHWITIEEEIRDMLTSLAKSSATPNPSDSGKCDTGVYNIFLEPYVSHFMDTPMQGPKNVEELGLKFQDACQYSSKRTYENVETREGDDDTFLNFRVGINIFNRFPEKGIEYLVQREYLHDEPETLAHFFLNCVGLSKYKIGSYIANLSSESMNKVFSCMLCRMDFRGQTIDDALRRLQENFHLSGKKKNLQKMMAIFCKRYKEENLETVKEPVKVLNVLACAILFVTTEFILERQDDVGEDIFCQIVRDHIQEIYGDPGFSKKFLKRLYQRITRFPFQGGSDYVTQIESLPLRNADGTPAKLATYYRRLVYDGAMFMRDLKRDRIFLPLRLQLRKVYVLFFNDMLAVVKKKFPSNFYVVKTTLDFTEIIAKRFHVEGKSVGIHFMKKDKKEVFLELQAPDRTVEMRVFWILDQLIKEVKETNRLLKDMGVLDLPVPSASDDEIRGCI